MLLELLNVAAFGPKTPQGVPGVGLLIVLVFIAVSWAMIRFVRWLYPDQGPIHRDREAARRFRQRRAREAADVEAGAREEDPGSR